MSKIGKAMAIKPLERVRQCRRPNSSTRLWEVAGIEAHLADAWAKDQATHSVNLVAIEHNKEMRGRIDLVADKTLLADARTCLQNVRDA